MRKVILFCDVCHASHPADEEPSRNKRVFENSHISVDEIFMLEFIGLCGKCIDEINDLLVKHVRNVQDKKNSEAKEI